MTFDAGAKSFTSEQVRSLIDSSLDAVIAIDEAGDPVFEIQCDRVTHARFLLAIVLGSEPVRCDRCR